MNTIDITEKKAKICAHCIENFAVDGELLCSVCEKLPRCEVCQVFFDGLCCASVEDASRCEACLDFELLIKFKCFLCQKPIPIYRSKRSTTLHYIVRGNACVECNTEADRLSKISNKEEYTPQFTGYLSMLEVMYNSGKIDRGQWEYAIMMNPHDVLSWDGYEGIKLELDEITLPDITIEELTD